MISIIVAVADNNVIGKDNSLIWKLPADMKFFKDKTTNHCIITGRKNYESIPEKFRPLPNRTNIVVTRQAGYEAPGAIVSDTIEDAIHQAFNIGDTTGYTEIFIIGGGEIYKQALKYADKVYLTRIYKEFDGDTFFPDMDDQDWEETDRVQGPVDDKNLYAHDYITYERK